MDFYFIFQKLSESTKMASLLIHITIPLHSREGLDIKSDSLMFFHLREIQFGRDRGRNHVNELTSFQIEQHGEILVSVICRVT